MKILAFITGFLAGAVDAFLSLFKGKKKDIPQADVSSDTRYERFHEVRPRLEDLEGISVERTKAGGDIIGRQGGQKRNRTHIFRQPFGYPIRFCDWIAVDKETIERIGECQGLFGPADLPALDIALDWAEGKRNAVICKHCRALALGKRGPVMGRPGGPA